MRCTAKSKRSGKQCKNPAMRGKDKCPMHGGKTPIKHGLYSKYAPALLAAKIEEMRQAQQREQKLTDIVEQLAVLHALSATAMEAMKQAEAEKDTGAIVTAAGYIEQITETICRNIERHAKLTVGEKHLVTWRPDLSQLTDAELEILERILTRISPKP